jgi:hypothetical protein
MTSDDVTTTTTTTTTTANDNNKQLRNFRICIYMLAAIDGKFSGISRCDDNDDNRE